MLETILNEDNPLIQIIHRSDLDDNDGNVYYGLIDDEVSIRSGLLYKPIQDTDDPRFMSMQLGPKGILHQDVAFMWEMYGDRNLYTNTCAPAQLYSKKHPEKFNMDVDQFRLEFSRIHSGIVHDCYNEFESQYLMTMPYILTHLIYTKYHCTNRLSNKEFRSIYQDHPLQEFKPTIVDRELLQAIRNPGKYIEILLKKLQLNEELGYYCSNGIPLICSHEIMLAQGCSMKEVLEACANRKYACRYCGADLVIDMDDTTVDLTALQFRLIYLFVESLNMLIYETFLLNILSEVSQRSLEKLELEISDNYMEQMDAFIATYMYRLYLHLKKEIKFDNVTGLISTCNRLWSKAGWDDETVQTLMKNDERFVSFNHVYRLIISFKEASERKESDNIALELFLEKMNGKGNTFQQIWSKDKSKLGELNDLIFIDANNNSQLIDWKSIIDHSKITMKVIPHELNLKSGLSLRSFYHLWGEYICPINSVHEFVKGTCKHCGFNDKSIDAVYEKYLDKLINLINPKSKPYVNNKDEHRTELIKQINSQSTKVPDITGMEEIMSDSNMNALRKRLEELIGIGHLAEIPVSKEMNAKMINYLLNSVKMSADTISVELSSLIIKPNPLYDKLLMIL